MSLYSIHFFIAVILAMIVAMFLSRSWQQRIVALVVPFIIYNLFYDFNYGIVDGFFPIVSSYVSAISVCLLFLFFLTYKLVPVQEVVTRKIILKIFLLSVLQFVCVLYSTAIPWAFDTFPLSNIEAVLFTLFAGTNEGAEEFVVSSISRKVINPSIKIFSVLLLIQMTLALVLPRMNKGVEFKFKKIRYSLNSSRFKTSLLQLQKGLFALLTIYCFVLSLIIPGIMLSAPFQALFQIPVDSELYRNHFICPDSLNLRLPENPKNLIVIMMESMETNFERYTPEIVSLQQHNANFPPGGVSVAGTSWTIAGITGKLCGIPLNMPMNIGEYLGKLPTYLPGAKCLMNVLDEKGYNQVFVQGSSGDFTQKRKFWTEHGNVSVHDIEYYKQNGGIPKDYKVFWGFEDRKLYKLAKQELDTLSKRKNPFVLYLLTVDTHQPEGFIDSQCAEDFLDINEKFPKALRCASKQLEEFLDWMKQQMWYENTVISVMGDHTMPSLSLKAGVSTSDSLYWTNFIINSAVTTPVRERQYSSLDMFPTLLEAMGFELEKHGAGLGRSLYSDSLTMLELYGRKMLDSLLRERSIQYDEFLFGK